MVYDTVWSTWFPGGGCSLAQLPVLALGHERHERHEQLGDAAGHAGDVSAAGAWDPWVKRAVVAFKPCWLMISWGNDGRISGKFFRMTYWWLDWMTSWGIPIYPIFYPIVIGDWKNPVGRNPYNPTSISWDRGILWPLLKGPMAYDMTINFFGEEAYRGFLR